MRGDAVYGERSTTTFPSDGHCTDGRVVTLITDALRSPAEPCSESGAKGV